MIQKLNYKQELPIILVTSTLLVLVLLIIGLILPKPVDDIPLAQGLQETSIESQTDIFNKLISLVTVVTIGLFVAFQFCKLFNIHSTKIALSVAIVSTLGGVVLASSPIAEDLIWAIVLRFHLKQYDQYLTFFILTIRILLALGWSILLGLGLAGVHVLPSRGG